MAGRGPAPKPANQRARRNKDASPTKLIEVRAAPKPPLPAFHITVNHDGMMLTQEFTWPEPTVEWWKMLDDHPLAGEFTAADWSFLLDTARIHAAFWMGSTGLASELRLREAKYGFTPEDRLRLRWQVAAVAGAEADAVTKTSRAATARERYGQTRRVELGELPKAEDGDA